MFLTGSQINININRTGTLFIRQNVTSDSYVNGPRTEIIKKSIMAVDP